MKLSHIITTLSITVLMSTTNAQQNNPMNWNNKKCAIVLTYDDALNVHLDNVIPALDSARFKGTFYVPGNAETLYSRLNEWRDAANNGHELGNHTVFHPCAGKSKGREWVSEDYDLDNYTLKQIVDEIKVANTLLKAIDGKTERTFAYTCGDMQIGDASFVDSIRNTFVGARGVTSQILTPENIDLFNISTFAMGDNSAEELINIVKQAETQNGLVVFLFHGVGGEHAINTALEAHNELLHYLKNKEDDIWVAPLIEIVNFIGK
ncbi:MAG: polysaccharide deacetylase family protein [Salinivirgaceae bacterium]|jgi:peptidoglycan/xylan/chitin deacetylase (PgdA/CDA1 family)|nr:polysaccharide deacetylase family protein [Salinivirgaceae bacterium]